MCWFVYFFDRFLSMIDWFCVGVSMVMIFLVRCGGRFGDFSGLEGFVIWLFF